MRYLIRALTVTAAVVLALRVAEPALVKGQSAQPLRPCISAKTECTEWITFGGGPARSMFYRTFALDQRNDRITRAFVLVHGAGRDADNYFRTALAAAFLADALENTIVISPRFASSDRGCQDKLAPNEVSWPCNGDSWRSGGAADVSYRDGKLTSYDFMDEILKKVAARAVFPNLRAIVVSGHSAGGQFTNRYEMANTLHETIGVPIAYVVANPSSYAYLDPTRPAASAAGANEFRPFGDARNCTAYDKWPYGLQNRSGGYASRLTDDQLRQNREAVHGAWRLGFDDNMHSLRNGFFQGWDLHPAQFVTRYAAVYQFFLGSLESASNRLKTFVEKAALASLFGDVFDDAATGQGLLNFFLRGLACGAITEEEALATGLSLDEIRSRSFLKILLGRRTKK